jgi:hypothetical protein
MKKLLYDPEKHNIYLCDFVIAEISYGFKRKNYSEN